MTRIESHARQTTDRTMIDESERRHYYVYTCFHPRALPLSLSFSSRRSTRTIACRRVELLINNNNNVARVNAARGSAGRGFATRLFIPVSRTMIPFSSSRAASFMEYLVGHRMRRSNPFPRNEIPEPTSSRRDPPGHKTLRDPGRSRSTLLYRKRARLEPNRRIIA